MTAALVTGVASIVGVILTRTIPERRSTAEAKLSRTSVPAEPVTTPDKLESTIDNLGPLHATDQESGAIDPPVTSSKRGQQAETILIAEAAFQKGTQELLEIVKPVRRAQQGGIKIVPVDETWNDNRSLRDQAPLLLIIHSSAFQYVAEPKRHERALFQFIGTFSTTHPSAKYLVYNAGFCDPAVAARWKVRFHEWITSNAPATTAKENVDVFGFGCPQGSATGSIKVIQASVARMLEMR